MKKTRLFFSALIILTFVGSALAFKSKPMNQGSVYCNTTCTNKIDFRLTTSTTNITDPCENGAGKEYVLINECTPKCYEVTCGQFESVTQ